MVKVHNFHHNTAPDDAIFIGRGSKWGNPYSINKWNDREEVIQKFKDRILPNLDLTELIGYDLVCYCKPAKCHGDVIIERIKELYDDSRTPRGP